MYARTTHLLIPLLLWLLQPGTTRAQYEITVVGLPEGSTVYLDHYGQHIDSTTMAGGRGIFRSAERLKDAMTLQVSTPGLTRYCPFWALNDRVKVSFLADGTTRVEGSQTEADYQDYQQYMKQNWDEMADIIRQQKADKSKTDSLQRYMYTVLKPRQDSLFTEWARRHPASHIALDHILSCRQIEKYDYRRYMKMVAVIDTTAFDGQRWATLRSYMEHDRRLEPGMPCPTLRLPDVYGDTLDLSTLRGQYVLLTVSRCLTKDYLADLPLRRDLYTRWHEAGLEMVDLLTGDTLADLIKPAANFGLRWQFVGDFKGMKTPFIADNHIDHLPHNWLIAPDGTIVLHNVWGNALRQTIDSIFNTSK